MPPTREIAKALERIVGRAGPLLTLVPGSIYGSLLSAHRRPRQGVPSAPMSLRTTGEYALDEFVIAVQTLLRDIPTSHDVRLEIERVGEIASELSHLRPRDLHPPSVVPVDAVIQAQTHRRFRTTWETLTFDVPLELPAPFTQSTPWLRSADCRRAQVRLLRHRGASRPWVIVVHGAEQGTDFDMIALRVRRLHEGLGLNVAVPVLPLHGPRRTEDIRIPGFDVVSNVLFALVAVAEIRALRRWIAAQGDPSVALYGVSLGGYITALTAGVERDLDVVIAGIPMVSMHRLLARHASRSPSREGRAIGALMRSAEVRSLERFVDPLRFEPAVPIERRYIVAGLVDQVTTPHQALELWHHWEQPEMLWYPGGHLGHLWLGEVHSHVDRALSTLHGDHHRGTDDTILVGERR